MFRVIISGSRTFRNYEMLECTMDHLLQNVTDDIQIVCGKARGADALGEMYANDRGYDVRYFPADWEGLGKSAGFRRNELMADNADALVAFWNGKSNGTKHMIQVAKQKKLKVRVKLFDEDADLY